MKTKVQRKKLNSNAKFYNQEKGITLIALVVTIVVLLILAGVSISLVLNNNGVISKAKDAKNQYAEAQTNEEKQLNEVADWISTKVGETTGGGNTPTEPETPTTGNASSITKDDYGKVVTNYKDGHTWEIFYADNTNVYLITRDNVGDQTVYDKVTNYNGTSDFDGSANFKTKYPAIQAGWLNKTYTPSASGAGTVNYKSTNPNMEATEYLLDSSVWNTTYKTAKADWTIGAPTLEMLVASYNKKYKEKAVTIDTPTGFGYKHDDALHNNNSLPPSDSVTSGTAQSNIYNHGYDYWPACPSSLAGNLVRIVSSSDAYVGTGAYHTSLGVRPVVCLNSGVTLTREPDGTFTIKNK